MNVMEARERRAMLDTIRALAREVEHELMAAGNDEVKENPILAAKRQVVDQAYQRLARWEKHYSDASRSTLT